MAVAIFDKKITARFGASLPDLLRNVDSEHLINVLLWARNEARFSAKSPAQAIVASDYAFSVAEYLLLNVYPTLFRNMGKREFAQLMNQVQQRELHLIIQPPRDRPMFQE